MNDQVPDGIYACQFNDAVEDQCDDKQPYSDGNSMLQGRMQNAFFSFTVFPFTEGIDIPLFFRDQEEYEITDNTCRDEFDGEDRQDL